MTALISSAESPTLWLRVTVPIASFAIPYAREFVETYPFPTPTTIYGMLLSLIGETDRYRYEGSRIAVWVMGIPAQSLVLRKIRRFKKKDITSGENSKPDYQTVLTGLEFITAVQDSKLSGIPSLRQVLDNALSNPGGVERFGGLSCGESHHLIDTLSKCELPLEEENQVWELCPEQYGEWTIPLWVDHVGSKHTRWTTAAFRTLQSDRLDNNFFVIASQNEGNFG